jgi:hypothetical protein
MQQLVRGVRARSPVAVRTGGGSGTVGVTCDEVERVDALRAACPAPSRAALPKATPHVRARPLLSSFANCDPFAFALDEQPAGGGWLCASTDSVICNSQVSAQDWEILGLTG